MRTVLTGGVTLLISKPHQTSKTERRRAVARLERLNDQLYEMRKNTNHPEYQVDFERALAMIREMRRIVRNTDFTKTIRKRWPNNVCLTEIMVLGLKA